MNAYARGINKRWWRQFDYLHSPAHCEGRVCPVHHPTRHHLRHLPRLWRPDRGMLERLCEHGIGHPDPDQVAAWRHLYGEKDAGTLAVHGCDGCCRVALREDTVEVTADTMGQIANAVADPPEPTRALRAALGEDT